MREPRVIYPTNPPGIFTDERGSLAESWRAGKGIKAAKCGLTSMNRKGALRGLHYQRTNPRALIVRCAYGTIWDVALDIRRDSPSYGRFYVTRLTAAGHEAAHIPEGFAHGFYAMTDAVVIYECSEFFDPDSHTGIKWDDPAILPAWDGIVTAPPIVSATDQALPSFKDTAPIVLGE